MSPEMEVKLETKVKVDTEVKREVKMEETATTREVEVEIMVKENSE